MIEKQSIWDHNAETMAYCRDDVRILYEGLRVYMEASLEKSGINPWKSITVAPYCRRVWNLHHYDVKKYPLAVLTKEEYDFIHSGFYGGQTETFCTKRTWSEEEITRDEGGKYVDVCSLYPSVQYYDKMTWGELWWRGCTVSRCARR